MTVVLGLVGRNLRMFGACCQNCSELTMLQMLSWGPNIINILGMKHHVRMISTISDNVRSLSSFTGTSYRRAIPSNPDVFLSTPLCF